MIKLRFLKKAKGPIRALCISGHGILSAVWQPLDAHRRHRSSRSHCQDSRSFRLAHQSPTSFSGTGLPALSDGLTPPKIRFHPESGSVLTFLHFLQPTGALCPLPHTTRHTGASFLARSEKNEPVRPHSQEERPHVGQQSLGIESSTRSLVLFRLVKKALSNSYSQ